MGFAPHGADRRSAIYRRAHRGYRRTGVASDQRAPARSYVAQRPARSHLQRHRGNASALPDRTDSGGGAVVHGPRQRRGLAFHVRDAAARRQSNWPYGCWLQASIRSGSTASWNNSEERGRTTQWRDGLAPGHTRAADGTLVLGGVGVIELAQIYGTPLVVFDLPVMEDALASFKAACASHGVEISYAAKAFTAIELLRQLAHRDIGLDVCSLGELSPPSAPAFRRGASRCTVPGRLWANSAPPSTDASDASRSTVWKSCGSSRK